MDPNENMNRVRVGDMITFPMKVGGLKDLVTIKAIASTSDVNGLVNIMYYFSNNDKTTFMGVNINDEGVRITPKTECKTKLICETYIDPLRPDQEECRKIYQVYVYEGEFNGGECIRINGRNSETNEIFEPLFLHVIGVNKQEHDYEHPNAPIEETFYRVSVNVVHMMTIPEICYELQTMKQKANATLPISDNPFLKF